MSPVLHPPERPSHIHTPKPGFGGKGHDDTCKHRKYISLIFLRSTAVPSTINIDVICSPLYSPASRVVSSCFACSATATVAAAFPRCCCRPRRVSASLAAAKWTHSVTRRRDTIQAHQQPTQRHTHYGSYPNNTTPLQICPNKDKHRKTKPLFFLHDAAVRLTKKFGVLHSPLCSLASRVVSSCLAGNAAAVVASAFPWCCCRARRVSASLASTKYRYNVGESRPKCFFFEDELLYEQKVVFKSLLSRLQLQRDYHRVHLAHD